MEHVVYEDLGRSMSAIFRRKHTFHVAKEKLKSFGDIPDLRAHGSIKTDAPNLVKKLSEIR